MVALTNTLLHARTTDDCDALLLWPLAPDADCLATSLQHQKPHPERALSLRIGYGEVCWGPGAYVQQSC